VHSIILPNLVRFDAHEKLFSSTANDNTGRLKPLSSLFDFHIRTLENRGTVKGMATPITKRGPKKPTDKSTDKLMDEPSWRKCDKCEMFGGTDSFGDSCCRKCVRIADMEKRSEKQEKRICDLESRIEQLAEKLDKFTAREEAEMACRPVIQKA